MALNEHNGEKGCKRERRKMRRIFLLAILAALCVTSTWVAASLDNSGDDPTRELPLKEVAVVLPEPAEEEPASNGVEVLGEFAIVAYCPCEECCGKWALNRPDGIVYTASGEEAVPGVTVAVDPDIIPLGSKVYIDGLGWYIAHDTGAFNGQVIDVYFEDHDAAREFGRRDAVVGVVANG